MDASFLRGSSDGQRRVCSRGMNQDCSDGENEIEEPEEMRVNGGSQKQQCKNNSFEMPAPKISSLSDEVAIYVERNDAPEAIAVVHQQVSPRLNQNQHQQQEQQQREEVPLEEIPEIPVCLTSH